MLLPSFADRQRVTKLLASNHNLEIEKGRHHSTPIPREERKCTMCVDLAAVEDEMHFLIECPAYTESRNKILGTHEQDSIKAGAILEIEPATITKYLRTALKKRQDEQTYHVSDMAIGCMKLTVKKGHGPHLIRPEVTHVSQTFLCNTRLTLKKGKKAHPSVDPSPNHRRMRQMNLGSRLR